MMRIRLAASLWSVAPDALAAEARRLADAGLAHWHWDRADGTLGGAGGFSAAEARALVDSAGGGVTSEAHLMLREPLAELADWLAFCERVVVHVEADRWRDAVARVIAAGAQAAVAISPHTDAASLDLPAGVAVLVMSVQPGHGGAAFRVDAVERVRALSRDGRVEVGVDGGVTAERAAECAGAGARWLVSGTALVGADDPAAFLAAVAELSSPPSGPRA